MWTPLIPFFSRLTRMWKVKRLPPLRSAISKRSAPSKFSSGSLKRPNLTLCRVAISSTGLSLLDANAVAQQIVLPLLDPAQTPDPTPWYPMLAYLIGKVCIQDPVARAFLYTCLREIPDISLKGLALQSLGWLYDVQSKRRFEDIALGDFSSLNLPGDAPPLPPDAQLLQRKALEALRVIGDAATLTRLQNRPAALSPELEQAFYWTIEEIIARQNEE
jgi:hypothetical protein